MDDKSTRQLMLIRYYLSLAQSQALSGGEAARFATLNLLHEAFESTLIACADHLNLSIGERSTIDSYLSKIDESVGSDKLPYRTRILQFNRVRVSAKHALTLPDDATFNLALSVVPEFIRSAVLLIFKTELEAVHLVNLVRHEEARGYLQAALEFMAETRYVDSLAEVRKSIYVIFEKSYDLSVFAGKDDSDKYGILDERSLNNSPYYAKSSRYVRENISKPTQYIVLDHPRLENELSKDGIDIHTYWNVRRLTPSVWQKPDKTWLSDHVLDITENPSIKLDAEYCLDRATAMILQRESRRSVERYRNSVLRSIAVRPNAPILARASINSDVIGYLPDGLARVNVSDATQGLDSDDWYWSFFYMKKGGPFLAGYIRAVDTTGQLEEGINYFLDN